LKHEEFVQMVAEELASRKDDILATMDACYTYADQHRDSFNRNFTKWKILGTNVWPNSNDILALKTWPKQVEYTKEYLNNSLDYLLSVYPAE